jgi:hypothetical protein
MHIDNQDWKLKNLFTIPITEAEHTIGQFGWIDGIGEGSFVKALKLLLVETL